jgi:GMP synthase-like glutamine amidotransferase
MTRILVIQFDPDKTGGRIEVGMTAAGGELVRVMASEPIPDVAGFDGLVVLPSLLDPVDDRPEVHGARAAILAARAHGIPVLGVCLGGQLVAQAAGAEIYRSQPELGIHPVRTTPAAQDDPLLAGIPEAYDSFHAHAFAFRPVADATVLIETDACCQAMRIGDRTWAFQCHPEATLEWELGLADAIERDYSTGVPENTARFFREAGVQPDELRRRAVELDALHAEIGGTIGRRFVELCGA